MDYLTIKHLHITCVALSGSLFIVRGIWMLRASPLLGARWVKILPHLIDTGLLTSAVALAMISSQYPFAQNWLTAKVVGLLIYIGLGSIALKRGKTRGIRIAALLAAVTVFVYIGLVAVTKQPLIFISSN